MSRHAIGERVDEVQSKVRRYNDLCRKAIILGEEGSLSQESYDVALSAIKEAWKQCASLNNSIENSAKPHDSAMHGVCGVDEENQCITTSSAHKTPRRAGSGKEVARNGNNTCKKGKVPQLEATTLGTQDGLDQMQPSDSRPIQLHNVVPTMFQSVALTQLHDMASTHVHENNLPQ